MERYRVKKELELRVLNGEFNAFLTAAATKCGSGPNRFTALLVPGDVLGLDSAWTITKALEALGLLEAAPLAPEAK